MRDICDVIDKMIVHAPFGMAEDMRSIKEDMKYAAPETVGLLWDELAIVVNSIPYPQKEDWQKKVVAIFTDKPE